MKQKDKERQEFIERLVLKYEPISKQIPNDYLYSKFVEKFPYDHFSYYTDFHIAVEKLIEYGYHIVLRKGSVEFLNSPDTLDLKRSSGSSIYTFSEAMDCVCKGSRMKYSDLEYIKMGRDGEINTHLPTGEISGDFSPCCSQIVGFWSQYFPSPEVMSRENIRNMATVIVRINDIID